MTERDHPVDDALRRVAGQPTPSEADRRLGADRLAEAIAAEQRPQPRRRYRLTVGWAIGFGVLLVGLLVAVETISPTPTEAAIEEIAKAAEETDPLTIPPQQFGYTKSEMTALAIVPTEALRDIEHEREFLVYLLRTIRETWIGSEGAAQLRTTNQPPIFFSEADEDAYYTAGIDEQDAIGETTMLTTTDRPTEPAWPTDPTALDKAIRQAAVNDRGLPETVEYLDVALDILREPLTSPQLRAATLRLIAQLPDLELVETARDDSFTFAVEYRDQDVDSRQTFTLSKQGYLLTEEIRILEPNPRFGIPADTDIFTAIHTPATIVDDLSTTP